MLPAEITIEDLRDSYFDWLRGDDRDTVFVQTLRRRFPVDRSRPTTKSRPTEPTHDPLAPWPFLAVALESTGAEGTRSPSGLGFAFADDVLATASDVLITELR